MIFGSDYFRGCVEVLGVLTLDLALICGGTWRQYVFWKRSCKVHLSFDISWLLDRQFLIGTSRYITNVLFNLLIERDGFLG